MCLRSPTSSTRSLQISAFEPMDIKDELKEYIRGCLAGKASSFFLSRALGKIDEVETGKKDLADACDRVVKMIELFIDEKLAEEIMKNLQLKIERAELR